MKWEWENKVSIQRLLQKLNDADSGGTRITKAEARFLYDVYLAADHAGVNPLKMQKKGESE